MYNEDLLVKTIVASSPEEADRLINEFGVKHKVKATQSSPIYDFSQKKIVYIYTLFYLPKEKNKKILRDTPRIILSESEAKWTNCLICGKRWKWTHYKMCPNKHSLEGLPKEYHEEYKKLWLKDGMEMEMMENGNGDKKTD